MISRADLEGVLQGPPLGPIEAAEQPHQFSLWWLTSKSREPALLYGWLVPHVGRIFPSWTKREIDDRNFGAGSIKIERSTIDLTWRKAFELLGELAEGKSLEEGAATCGLPSPRISPTWVLASNTRELLPPIYLTSGASQAVLPSYARSRTSPVDAAGCYCYRFCDSQRLDFLREQHSPDELLRWAVQVMDRETGLGFQNAGAEALGSLEVLRFPLLLGRGSRLLVVTENNRRGATDVTIALREQLPGEALRVQVRATNMTDVVFDQMGEALTTESPVKFSIADPIDGVSVRVWHASTLKGPWVLWHEEDHHFIREISMSMNLMGLSGQLKSDWLERIGKSKRSARANALIRIQQVGHHQKMMTSTRQPWELAIQRTREAVRRVFPDSSGAVFFKKGWEGDSKLAFAEWIQREFSDHHGRIVVLDPYFDVPGLDLIARISGAAEEIVVVTSSQTPSDDDSLQPGVARADRLRRECVQLAPILSGIRLRIVDLRSTGGGKRQVFHDRYILFYDSDTEVSKGYHLSTSLQSATRTAPLLVTPIPSDTTDDVADYVAALLAEDAGTAERVVLYPDNAIAAEPWPNEGETLHLVRGLQALGLLNAAAPARASDLVDRGLLDDGRITLSWNAEHVENVVAAFAKSEFTEQVAIWCGLAEARAHGHSLKGFFEALATRSDTPLDIFLPRYLRAIAVGQADPGSHRPARQILRTLAHVFAGDYRKALKNAESFYDHVHRHPIGTSWSIYFASDELVHHFPERVESLVGQVALPSAPAEEILSVLAVAAVEAVRSDEANVVSSFLRAQTPFLRALAAVSIWRSIQGGTLELDALVSRVASFAAEDRAWTFSRAVYETRIRSNQGRAEERDLVLQRAVIQLFVHSFVELGQPDRIQDFIPELSGPVNGSWAQSTNDEVLIPLIERGFLPMGSLLTTWSAVLDEKIGGENSHFFPSTDAELLDVWGQAFWRATDAQREEVVTACRSEVARAERTLDEPFLGSRDYARWRASADRILWWLLRWGAVNHHRPDAASLEALVPLTKLVQDVVIDNGLVDSAIGEFRPAAAAVLEALR